MIDKRELIREYESLLYAKCERNFLAYFIWSWNVLEPSQELKLGWHHEIIAEYLQATFTGQIKRLIINMPPRYGKSNLCSVAFPTWAWVNEPSLRFLFTSYSGSLSTKHSVDRRTLIESAWYQYAWKHKFKMATDQNVKTEFANNKRGHMIASSMGGTATGKGGKFLIVDDPHDTTDVISNTMRDSTIQDFDQKFTSRLDDKINGVIILVMQRLHDQDLTGHLLKQGGWEHLKIPAIACKTKTYSFPISKREHTFNEEEILHPAREPQEILERTKKEMGTYAFTGQYLQEPSPLTGSIIKRDWLKFWTSLPENLTDFATYWDLAFKGSAQSDYVVGQVWAKHNAYRYLLAQIRARLDFPQTIEAFQKLAIAWPKTRSHIVEDKANGPALIAALREKVPGIIAYQPDASKEVRLSSVSPYFEAGNVLIPHPDANPWVKDYIEELVGFGAMAHDDQVDATSMALLRMAENNTPKIWIL